MTRNCAKCAYLQTTPTLIYRNTPTLILLALVEQYLTAMTSTEVMPSAEAME